MPNPGSKQVGQRRFWNAILDQPGIIAIGSWGGFVGGDLTGLGDGDYLWASDDGVSWMLVYTGDELASGPLPFPAQYKLSRFWKITHKRTNAGGSDWDGLNQMHFKPYSTDFALVGPNAWQRGSDWETANLFYDSCPFAPRPTTLHYRAHADISGYTTGFGSGGAMYGYLNNVYFGNNEMGGNKPNVGVGPKLDAIGDLSKEYVGFWGAFGIAHGTGPYSVNAYWVFDLCDRPEIMAVQAGLTGENQTEGWGTDVVNITTGADGHRHFILPASPARGTLNVYTTKGKMLMKGVDWDHDNCDQTGRVYKLLTPVPLTPCGKDYRVVVTFLVLANTLKTPRRTARIVTPDTAADRQRDLDIRGL